MPHKEKVNVIPVRGSFHRANRRLFLNRYKT